MVQTADTGQINWTTVTHPTVGNTSQGYEIWKFNDSLQGTVPVFFKLEYGGGNVAGDVSMWITLGSGSNGTGTVTGQLGTRTQASCLNFETTARTCVFSGDTNRMGFALFTNASVANCSIAIFLERTKNTDGTDSSLGAMSTVFGYIVSIGVSRTLQFIPATGGVPATTDVNAWPPVGTTSGSFVTDLAVYPNLHTRGGAYLNAGLIGVFYFAADIVANSTFLLPMYGTNHTYYPLGNGGNLANVGRGGFAGISLAMRYE
jgi:hypothetical protein